MLTTKSICIEATQKENKRGIKIYQYKKYQWNTKENGKRGKEDKRTIRQTGNDKRAIVNPSCQ